MNKNEYKKIYNINDFYNLIDLCIKNIKKMNDKYDIKIIKDKKQDNYYFLEKYYNNELKNKIYNTIDCLYMYLKGIKETLQDEEQD